MAHITKIKASDTPREPDDEPKVKAKKPQLSEQELESAKKIAKSLKESKSETKKIKTSKKIAGLDKAKEARAKADKKAEKKAAKKARRAEKKANRKPMPKWLFVILTPFRWIAKPFVALAKYIHESWLEIRQVSWPTRKATWKMTGAVLIYAAIFIVILVVLDMLFKFIFDNLLKG